MRSPKLQDFLRQLSEFTPAELGEIKFAVNEALERQLRTLGINGDLTEEEWSILDNDSLLSCVKAVRERTRLGLVDSKAYVERARAKGRPRTSTRQLRTLGINGDLTEEEWSILDNDSLLSCVKAVRERTRLGLVDSKAYVERARAKGRPRTSTLSDGAKDNGPDPQRSSGSHTPDEDSGSGLQRGSDGHSLYCPRGCCDDTGQDFGNGGRLEGSK